MSRSVLVLDANILIRAVLGRRVFSLLCEFHASTAFFAPDDVFADANKYLPEIFEARSLDWTAGAAMLARLPAFIQAIDSEVYSEFEEQARRRIRDPRDWPVLATAMALDCPIWTEDADFFGTGVATWTTATVEVFLSGGIRL